MTYFGKLDLTAESRVDQGKILIDLRLYKQRPERLREISLRVAHPRKQIMKHVLLNGREWQHLGREKELITLNATENHYAVEVQY